MNLVRNKIDYLSVCSNNGKSTQEVKAFAEGNMAHNNTKKLPIFLT